MERATSTDEGAEAQAAAADASLPLALTVGGDMYDAKAARLAAPCGLYCGICADKIETGECHGCGCGCGECAGGSHVAGCGIARCVMERGHESCADCPELACSRLIQFCCDPVWRTHGPVIENLRRRKRVGTEAWITEQEQFWSDPRRKRRWLALCRECKERWLEEQGG